MRRILLGMLCLAVGMSARAQAPFDLDIDHLDVNRLPLNPRWHAQATTCFPDADAVCNKKKVTKECATTILGIDTAKGFNLAICKLEASNIHGHINMAYATFDGLLRFEEHADDWDYHMVLTTDGLAGTTRANPDGFAVEFDSRETLDGRGGLSQWWKDFHELARFGNADQAKLKAQLNETNAKQKPYTIVTGLLGLDCEHQCHSELHPVYAIAIRTNTDPNGEHWAVLVRNWGNEGWCSKNNHPFPVPNNRFRIVLPNSKATDAVVVQKSFRTYTRGSAAMTTLLAPYPVTGVGMVLTFDLADPTQKEVTVGEITVKWKPTGSLYAAISPKCKGTAKPGRRHEAEDALGNLIQRLPADERARIRGVPSVVQPFETKSRDATQQERISRGTFQTLAASRQPISMTDSGTMDMDKAQSDEEFRKTLCSNLKTSDPTKYSEVCKE